MLVGIDVYSAASRLRAVLICALLAGSEFGSESRSLPRDFPSVKDVCTTHEAQSRPSAAHEAVHIKNAVAGLRFLTFDLTRAPASAPSAGATNSNTVVGPMLSIGVIQAQSFAY
ncbi:hypothetical protein NKI34_26415 [Mesorhizobium sp. M0700]|uniref:hypothetical protein n=1 Tax=Mesorhizobium sp. M0700 TaxID=2956988 RepID=UPI00333ABF0A